MKTKDSSYLIFSVLLVILSIIAAFFLFKVLKDRNRVDQVESLTSKIEAIPTDSPEELISDLINPIATPTAMITPKISVTPTLTATPSPTLKVTPSPIITSSSSTTSSTLTFSTSKDSFSVDYSNKRVLYQDTESSGNRYTFYLIGANFAVHVGLSDQWSWTHPNRQFTSNLSISGQPTFRYDISTQSIVDFQANDKNYTIQCVHNGTESLKTECETFIANFKLL